MQGIVSKTPLKWIVLAAALVYFALLSVTVQNLLDGDFSPRVRLVLQAGWAAALALTLGLAAFLAFSREERLYRSASRLRAWVDDRSAALRGLLFAGLLLAPAVLTYSTVHRGIMNDESFRLLFVAPFVLLAAQVLPFAYPKSFAGRLALTILAAGYLFATVRELSLVTDYPFPLSWSEGNRFYDYSLAYGNRIYQYEGELAIPYSAPGRYGLWGIWFLIPGLPVWFHRLWNAVLWFLPPLLAGWFVAQGEGRGVVRLGIALWAALFVIQGPIYAPLLLSALMVAAFARSSPWKFAIAVALASLYAGLSRWTWFPAPGAWAALIVLFSPHYDQSASWLRRGLRAAAFALAGSLPGLLANWDRLAAPKQDSLALSQPLLWYRLLPNTTYKPGILWGAAVAVGALVILLVWLAVSRRWKVDWLQALAASVAFLGFLGAGLVASTKIGGGSNLHNLDMFLVTLLVLVMLYLFQKGFAPLRWPYLAQGLLVLAILVPTWKAVAIGKPLDLAPDYAVEKGLNKVERYVNKYRAEGDVLFIDHRQLLTFGEIDPVPLVAEYEKKYLMDQAMAGNAAYFEDFYTDLEEKRFALIISEPLFTNYQDQSYAFSEENNAWVRWVSEPLLCYYEPIDTVKEVKLQFLRPREDVSGCP